MQNKDEELVLVVRTEVIFPDGPKDGFFKFSEKNILETTKTHGTFLKRKLAEDDSSWQQIIPQICLVVDKKIFIHKIPQTGNEGRLHDMWPIFLGGHVNNFDGDIEKAITREFEEEITYKGNIIKKEFLGLVKLNSPKVNSVHTGLVWVFEGDNEYFEPTADNGLIDGKFIPIKNLSTYKDKMTYWSKIVAPFLIKKYT